MKNDTFANRLKKAMNLQQITQIDLSKKTNIDKSLINKYLKGVAEAGNDKLSDLAEALNVNEVWLMGYDVSMQPIEQKKTEEEQDEVYKKILKDNGLMDENDNINEEDFKKLIDFAVANKDFLIKKDKD